MNFREAMDYKCPECGQPTKQHRLTWWGHIYCLRPNRDDYFMGKPLKVWASTTNVSMLRKSPIPHEVGKYINEVLGDLKAVDKQLEL